MTLSDIRREVLDKDNRIWTTEDFVRAWMVWKVGAFMCFAEKKQWPSTEKFSWLLSFQLIKKCAFSNSSHLVKESTVYLVWVVSAVSFCSLSVFKRLRTWNIFVIHQVQETANVRLGKMGDCHVYDRSCSFHQKRNMRIFNENKRVAGRD